LVATFFVIVVKGIYNFITHEGKYSDVPDDVMDSILRRMDSTPWVEAVYEALAEKNPWLYQIITDHTRTDYLFLQEFSKVNVVLDLGSGWGQSAFAMAKMAGLVMAMDSNSRRVKFIAKRASQEKVDKVIPVQADVLKLPFKDESFDFISMIGVLEWVAVDVPDDDPADIQHQALKEVYRVLKKGGSVCIGIENS